MIWFVRRVARLFMVVMIWIVVWTLALFSLVAALAVVHGVRELFSAWCGA